MECHRQVKFLHVVILFSFPGHAISQLLDPLELLALFALKASFNNTVLNNDWRGDPCPDTLRSSWRGVRCDNGRVTRITLEGMGLTGTIRNDSFMLLTELRVLSLKNNALSGNVMEFSSNRRIEEIDLSGNRFDGSIPAESLLSLNLLRSLQLQDNNLSGLVPGFNQSNLVAFNVSNNNLHGPIPKTPTLQSFTADSYANNPDLCDTPLWKECSGVSKAGSDNNVASGESNGKSSKSDVVTILIIVNVLIMIVLLLLVIHNFKKARSLGKGVPMEKEDDSNDNDEDNAEDEGDDYVLEAQKQEEPEAVRSKNKKQLESVSVSVSVSDSMVVGEEQKKLIFMEDEPSFDLNDLFKASAEGLAKGNFGHTYKATIQGRPPVVVKRIRDLRPFSTEEFIKQLHLLSDLKHPNLLPLLAYYSFKDEKLLVYKYAEKGNLFNRIHGRRGTDRIPFRWCARLSVARVVGRAIEYLHTSSRSQSIVPHGNLKSTNVLLDENEQVLVCDYGLTSLIAHPIAAQRMVAFRSPEYKAVKRVSKKSDVWSYGTILLELLTGKAPVCSPAEGPNVVDLSSWVHRAVREEWTGEIFDGEISGQRSASNGMLKLLQIAIRCCEKAAEKRPEMTEVVREVESIKVVDSSDDEDLSMDQSLTDDSFSTTVSALH